MMCKELSIIVPVYNVEKYIDKCIESIINQKYKNFEVILVDDGSKDNSGRICDEWQKKDSRIRVIHKKNGGLVSAWKEGLRESKYEWIVFVDSDDWIEREHLSKLIKNQNDTNSEIVITHMKQICFDGSEKQIDIIANNGFYVGEKLNDLYSNLLNEGEFEKRTIPFSRCSKLIKKDLMVKNLKYVKDETTYEEDFNIMFPTILDANAISIIEETNSCYCYRFVENSMLHGYDRNMNESISNVYESLYKMLKDKNKENLKPQLDSEFINANIRNVTNELQNPKGIKEISKNIFNISKNSKLKECLRKVKRKKYPFRFKIIIYILTKYNLFSKYIIVPFLYFLKKGGKMI